MVKTLLVAALVAAQAAAAQDHSRHGKAMAERPALGASAAYDAKGTLWAVRSQGGHVLLHRSNDFGRMWDPGIRVNALPEAIGADGDARPRVAIGPRGEVYVTWTQLLSKPYTGNIRFARSLDAGRSFGAPVTVHTDRQEITHRFDSIAVSRAGQLFIAWIDKRDQAERAKQGDETYRGAALYYAVSDDGGATLRGDFRVADHSCECCRIALLPQADGSVLALWRHVFEPNVRDHAIATLHPDGRATGFARATFDDWRIDACPHHGPSLARDGQGRLHAVWYSGAPGREGVYYGRLAGGRVEGQRRVGDDTAAHADIAIAESRIAIAWKEFDGTRSRLQALRSDDGGATWRQLELGTAEGATDQPKVLVRGDRFDVVWNTTEQTLRTVAIPEAEAKPFDGASLAQIRRANAGKPFVLAFWSVHCEPCRHEMPVWRQMREQYPDVPVLLVSVDAAGEGERRARFLARHDPGSVEHWQFADAVEERVRFSVDPRWRGELPRTYFYDANHRVEAHTGVPDAGQVGRWLARVSRR